MVALLLAAGLTAAACGDDSANTTDAPAGSADPAVANVAAFTCPIAEVGQTRTGPASGKLQVVTTVAPITSIVANVAGNLAEVRGVIPEGEDSHTYEPKPSVAETFTKADVVLVNGLKLEDPTKELAETNVPKTAQIIELGTRTITEDQYIFDFSFPRDGGKPNPHLWTNPPMAKCYATITAAVLSKADPANAAGYQSNAAKYTAKLDELDRLMVAATATIPESNRALLTYHDAYAYFAAHYGWKVIGAIQVSSFEDPTPKEVADLIKQIKAEKVPAIFGSEVFPSPVLAQIAKETGTNYVDELRDDDLPGSPGDADHSFLGLMKFDFVTMVTSLGGNPGPLEAFDATDVTTDTADYPQ
jgi:ABC-type Zn uptake system ZnuABC Zn-binding protein ZnuA